MSIEVHVDWKGRTHQVGHLNVPDRGSSATFEYAQEWLRMDGSFAIDPTALPLRPGAHHNPALFGSMQDCGPDRWGRVLIERAVRKGVLPQKPYRDIDYVLALDDGSRLGALRFRMAGNGPFLAATVGKLPPVLRLKALLSAVDAIHSGKETEQDLRFILGAGSPLGGARPKSAVSLDDNGLAIAKFSKPDDTRDIAAGEVVALALARQAGIKTADYRYVPMGAYGAAVITRFDRAGNVRIPFISASTLLGLPAGAAGAYTLMADGIRRFGDDVLSDLRELWRRLVFSLLASNHDDHLRNHGFLMFKPGRWSLSPAYDLNPVPEVDRVRAFKTPISEDQNERGMAGALAVAPRFGLKAVEAKSILGEVFLAVHGWSKWGKRLGLKAAALDVYSSAFEHPLMDETARLLGKPKSPTW